MRNLLEDALKYAPGTLISVHLGPHQPNGHGAHREAGQEALLIEVEDGGPGIPAEEKDAIFERFYRRDNSYTRSVGGVGLGLTISRALVEVHGGKMWVEDVYQGKGCVFKFTLPYSS